MNWININAQAPQHLQKVFVWDQINNCPDIAIYFDENKAIANSNKKTWILQNKIKIDVSSDRFSHWMPICRPS